MEYLLFFSSDSTGNWCATLDDDIRKYLPPQMIATIGYNRSIRLFEKSKWDGKQESFQEAISMGMASLQVFLKYAVDCYMGGCKMVLSDVLMQYAGISNIALLKQDNDTWSITRYEDKSQL